MEKSKMFIGSSIEGLDIAYAIQENLYHEVEVTIWSQGIFELSSTTFNTLLKISKQMDFGLFVFSPDDIQNMRGNEKKSIRDNVLLEYGLFLGALGPDRCFMMVPEGEDELHIPTDLLGVTPAKYESSRDDANWQAATGPGCNQVRRKIKEVGPIDRRSMNDGFIGSTEKSDEVLPNTSEDIVVAFENQQFDVALEYLEQEIAQLDEGSEGWVILQSLKGKALFETGKGLGHLEKLRKEYPSNVYSYWQLTQTLGTLSRDQDALTVTEEGIVNCESSTVLKIEKVDIFIRLGRQEDAILFLSSAIEKQPTHAALHLRLISLLRENDDSATIFHAYQNAIKNVPGNFDILYSYADFLTDQREWHAVLQLADRLVAMPGANSAAYILRGNACLELQLNDMAMNNYKKAKELSGTESPWAMANLGNLLNNCGLYTESIFQLKNALECSGYDDSYAFDRLASATKARKEQTQLMEKYLDLGARALRRLSETHQVPAPR